MGTFRAPAAKRAFPSPRRCEVGDSLAAAILVSLRNRFALAEAQGEG
jgi:hypothetical protein